jgi:hypothetical protein
MYCEKLMLSIAICAYVSMWMFISYMFYIAFFGELNDSYFMMFMQNIHKSKIELKCDVLS